MPSEPRGSKVVGAPGPHNGPLTESVGKPTRSTGHFDEAHASTTCASDPNGGTGHVGQMAIVEVNPLIHRGLEFVPQVRTLSVRNPTESSGPSLAGAAPRRTSGDRGDHRRPGLEPELLLERVRGSQDASFVL